MAMGGAWMGGTHGGYPCKMTWVSPPPLLNMATKTQHVLEDASFKHCLPTHGNPC